MAKTESNYEKDPIADVASIKSRSGSTTSVPRWLFLSTLICLLLRLGLYTSDTLNPPKASESIQWRTTETISAEDRGGDRLFFYAFGADWCEPCKQMEKTTYQSLDVVRELNKEFIPVKVIDRKREDGKNTAAVQELEDTFSVQAFPTVVVAMPDGTKIEERLGAVNTYGMKKFLSEAIILADYFHGKEALIRGEARQAAVVLDKFLQKTNWSHWRVPYAAIFCAIAYTEDKNEARAKEIVNTTLERSHDHAFPYPITQYLAGKISFDKLLSEAGERKGDRIMAYAYAGMQDFAQGKYSAAKLKLDWVLVNSTDETSFEYRVAKSELARIPAFR